MVKPDPKLVDEYWLSFIPVSSIRFFTFEFIRILPRKPGTVFSLAGCTIRSSSPVEITLAGEFVASKADKSCVARQRTGCARPGAVRLSQDVDFVPADLSSFVMIVSQPLA